MELVHQPEEIISERYRIIDTLGQGGSGTTYLAEDLQSGERVALKALSLRRMTDWKMMELFEREARILAQLNYPAIPRYKEYFYTDTRGDRCFYIAQQLAEGKSLATLVQEGWRSSEEEVRSIAIEILEILVYLHKLRPPVIHRDIKPQNIIRREDGKVFLVDFGAVQDTYHNTFMRGSTVVGTYGYMAPEQFRGQAVPTTDLYSLGATLLFLLTHRSPADLPVDGLKIDFRDRVQISSEFADWLEKMLEPDVEDRFPSTKEALEVLRGKRMISEKPRQSLPWKAIVGLGVAAVVSVSVLNYYKYTLLDSLGITSVKVYRAVTDGDVETLRRYLERGGNANAKREDGDTLLHLAVGYNRKDMAELLIAKGADVNAKGADVDAKGYYGDTPLHSAAVFGMKDMAELLIAKGADVNAKNKSGDTPLLWAVHHNREAKDVAELLIAKGADVNAKDKSSYFGNTPLHWAVYHNWKAADVAELLIAKGADVNAKNNDGSTPLHWALIYRRKNVVKLLIAKGADVNAKDNYGYTLLHAAAQANSKDVVELLIARDADVNARDKKGSTLLHSAAQANSKDVVELLIAKGADVNARDKKGSTLLHSAAQGNSKDVVELLIAKGADVNARDKKGSTLLHSAAQGNSKDVVKLLIAKGVDVNAKNNFGDTPLHWVAENYFFNKDVVELLIAKGADVNAKNNVGSTPLHWAAKNDEDGNSMDVAELLIARDADVNAKNNDGSTPLHLAAKKNNKYMVEVLKSYGGKE